MKINSIQINRINFSANTKKPIYDIYTPLTKDDCSWYTNMPIQRGQMLCDNKIAVFNRPTTSFFRKDMDWDLFAKYLKNHFNNQDKINTYIYGCSNGAEAYSLSILLQEIFKEDAKKFFPITASDIRENMIMSNKIDKDENFGITHSEYKRMKYLKCFKNDPVLDPLKLAKYAKRTNCSKYRYCPYVLTQEATDKVIFKTANILDDIDSINSNCPSIIMCRNMWPYIKASNYNEFTSKLYKKLAPKSIVVIGHYDYLGEVNEEQQGLLRLKSSNEFPKSLEKAGFIKSKTKIGTIDGCENLIFEKNNVF